MNKIVKGLVVTGLAVTGFMGVATFATPQVNASRVHYVKWNKPMKHHLVAVNGRKASWAAFIYFGGGDMDTNVQTMSKDSLLDTLSVLDKAERIYEGALEKKRAISDNWQQHLYDAADK